MLPYVPRTLFALLVIASTSGLADAQIVGADTLSPKSVADSQKVLQALDAKVRANPNDGPTWNHIGMLAWALLERSRAPGAPKDLDGTRLGRMADTSLRMAAQIAPQNAYYKYLIGRFLLLSGAMTARTASGAFFEQSLNVARKNDDPNLHAEAAIELGRVAWRQYDAHVNRRVEITPGSAVRSLSTALNPSAPGQEPTPQPLKVVQELIETGTMPLPASVTGEHYFTDAADLFREAYTASPTNVRAFRSVAMVLAEKNQWKDLENFSRTHLKDIPWDPRAWMSLGLALQRMGNSKDAAAAFDSSMSLSDPKERARLDRIERVLPSADSVRISKGTEAARNSYAQLYWLLADPLWSRAGNESRVEYLARVTFAELRWTVDEFNVRGADTDRGDTYIRYGPPDLVAAFGPVVAAGMADAQGISTTWVYKSGLAFVFIGQPTYATSHTAAADIEIVHALTQLQPVRWDNLGAPKVDTIATMVSRFRAGADSVDIYVATETGLDSIAKSSNTGSGVRGDVWFVGGTQYHDSLTLKSEAHAWTRRVAPGAYIFRMEATADNATRAGRTTAVIDAANNTTTGLALKGESISDVLLATSAERPNAVKSWRDVQVTPVTTSIKRGVPIALVWENYEFGAKDGNANYEISVAVSRQHSTAAKIGASIMGALASAARIDRGDDRVTIAFDRTLPHAPVIVDNLAINLSDTPAGKYLVTLQITDKVSGQSFTRTRNFVVRD